MSSISGGISPKEFQFLEASLPEREKTQLYSAVNNLTKPVTGSDLPREIEQIFIEKELCTNLAALTFYANKRDALGDPNDPVVSLLRKQIVAIREAAISSGRAPRYDVDVLEELLDTGIGRRVLDSRFQLRNTKNWRVDESNCPFESISFLSFNQVFLKLNRMLSSDVKSRAIELYNQAVLDGHQIKNPNDLTQKIFSAELFQEAILDAVHELSQDRAHNTRCKIPQTTYLAIEVFFRGRSRASFENPGLESLRYTMDCCLKDRVEVREIFTSEEASLLIRSLPRESYRSLVDGWTHTVRHLEGRQFAEAQTTYEKTHAIAMNLLRTQPQLREDSQLMNLLERVDAYFRTCIDTKTTPCLQTRGFYPSFTSTQHTRPTGLINLPEEHFLTRFYDDLLGKQLPWNDSALSERKLPTKLSEVYDGLRMLDIATNENFSSRVIERYNRVVAKGQEIVISTFEEAKAQNILHMDVFKTCVCIELLELFQEPLEPGKFDQGLPKIVYDLLSYYTRKAPADFSLPSEELASLSLALQRRLEDVQEAFPIGANVKVLQAFAEHPIKNIDLDVREVVDESFPLAMVKEFADNLSEICGCDVMEKAMVLYNQHVPAEHRLENRYDAPLRFPKLFVKCLEGVLTELYKEKLESKELTEELVAVILSFGFAFRQNMDGDFTHRLRLNTEDVLKEEVGEIARGKRERSTTPSLQHLRCPPDFYSFERFDDDTAAGWNLWRGKLSFWSDVLDDSKFVARVLNEYNEIVRNPMVFDYEYAKEDGILDLGEVESREDMMQAIRRQVKTAIENHPRKGEIYAKVYRRLVEENPNPVEQATYALLAQEEGLDFAPNHCAENLEMLSEILAKMKIAESIHSLPQREKIYGLVYQFLVLENPDPKSRAHYADLAQKEGMDFGKNHCAESFELLSKIRTVIFGETSRSRFPEAGSVLRAAQEDRASFSPGKTSLADAGILAVAPPASSSAAPPGAGPGGWRG